MSLGRKPKSSHIESEWQRVFFGSVGVYTQSIIVGLETLSLNGNGHSETGKSLLEKIRSLNGKSLPAINENEIPFDIPSHWVWCRLGDIIEFTSNLNIESKFSQDTLINYVDIDAIDNKQFEIREVKTKPVSELSSRARRVLKKGFIIYSLVRPYLNNLAIIDEDRNNFIGSTGFAVFNGILVKNEYLKFLLLTDFVRQRYLKLLSGFNSPGITQEQFINTLVPLPPLEEQERIFQFLNDLGSNSLKTEPYFNQTVERKIINLQHSQLKGSEISKELDYQLALVKELRQAYLREAMQGKLVPQDGADEPAEILLEKIKAEKEKLVAEKRTKREKPLPPITPGEIPFEIPSNWTWCRLGVLGICQTGTTPSTAEKDNFGNYIPFLKPADLSLKGINYLNEGLSEKGLKKGVLVHKDSLLMVCIGGSIGKSYFNEIDVSCNQQINVIKPLSGIRSQFLQYWLQSNYFQGSIWGKASGGTTPIVNRSKWESIFIPLPPLAEQERIVAKLEKLMGFCDELEANIKQGITNADRLLQTALKEALEPQIW